jgi:hypothetical protein
VVEYLSVFDHVGFFRSIKGISIHGGSDGGPAFLVKGQRAIRFSNRSDCMKVFSTWFGALAAIVMLAGPAAAADTIFIGKVKTVSAEKKTCVLTDAAGKDQNFALDAKVIVNRAGKESHSGLKAGDAVQVCYDPGVVAWTCHYIVVQEGDSKNWTLSRCTFKSYDAAKKQITFTDTADSKDFTFAMGDAKVSLNGEASRMASLKAGDEAVVIVDRTTGVDATLKAFLASRK